MGSILAESFFAPNRPDLRLFVIVRTAQIVDNKSLKMGSKWAQNHLYHFWGRFGENRFWLQNDDFGVVWDGFGRAKGLNCDEVVFMVVTKGSIRRIVDDNPEQACEGNRNCLQFERSPLYTSKSGSILSLKYPQNTFGMVLDVFGIFWKSVKNCHF